MQIAYITTGLQTKRSDRGYNRYQCPTGSDACEKNGLGTWMNDNRLTKSVQTAHTVCCVHSTHNTLCVQYTHPVCCVLGCAGLPIPAGIPDPTRTRGYASSWVDVSRVGSGTTSMGTGIPGFTRKEHDFSRFWSENFFLFLHVF